MISKDGESEPKPRLVVVEDDRGVLSAIKACLAGQGYRVIEASDGAQGLHLALQERPDLVILDVMLPHMTGFDVCRELRRLHFAAPILMLTACSLVEDRVSGLDAGADDYLAKPFDDRELLARIQSLLRRQLRDRQQTAVVELGEARVDFGKRVATRAGQPLALTKTEFSLLELLANSMGRPVSRKTILDVVWGYTRTPTTRTVDTHIWRLRKKLGDSGEQPRWIKLIGGQGYQLDVQPSTSENPGQPVA